MDMNGPHDDADNQSNSAENNDAEIENPGAYILPFAVGGQHCRPLDSLTDEYRAWAVRYLARVGIRSLLLDGIVNVFSSMTSL